MKILVCLKQILDPELPARDFRIDREKKVADPGAANQVTNIFCENALETALQFRDAAGGEITVLSFGPESAEDSLRKALAVKADNACLVTHEAGTRFDSAAAARVLAAAIKKLGEFDLIMVGREAGDWGAGQTGGLLAEELELPCISFVDQIAAGDGGALKLNRQTEVGSDEVTANAPLVVTITNNDQNVPSIPKTRDIMMSSRKPLETLSLGDLGLDAAQLQSEAAGVEVVDLYIPEKDTTCEFAEGEALDEKVTWFAEKLADIIRSI